MQKLLIAALCFWVLVPASGAEVLIVADEFPAMRVLAGKLKEYEGLEGKIVKQTEMPADLAGYQAVIVYIHMRLNAEAEQAFITYATNGGRLVCLHHSISSGKRTNANWFAFLGVDLPKKSVEQGGYKWIEGVEWDVVNLDGGHPVTTRGVKYEKNIPFTRENGAQETLPGFHLRESEVYLNHVLIGPRTILLGMKYTGADGKVWMQERAGWCKPAGKGWLFYFMPGHSVLEFENPAYTRIIANAIVWRPQP